MGELVHAVLARGPPTDLQVVRSLLGEAMPGLPTEEADRTAQQVLQACEWTFGQDRGVPGGHPLREEPFAWVSPRTVVRGRLDAAFLEGALPMVEDYKTGPHAPRDAREVRDAFGFQLLCYALSVRKGARPVHARVVHPLLRKVWAWEIAPRELEEFASRLKELAEEAVELLEGAHAPRGCGRADCPACRAAASETG
jgi:hypothetical protein